MALDPSNSSNLEQLALKGLRHRLTADRPVDSDDDAVDQLVHTANTDKTKLTCLVHDGDVNNL